MESFNKRFERRDVPVEKIRTKCPRCDGHGSIKGETCAKCHGSGWVKEQ